MAIQVMIVDDVSGAILDVFDVEPRTPDEQPLDTAHAIRDLIATVTNVTEQGDAE